MKIIRKMEDSRKATANMDGVKIGDAVLVNRGGKEIPCSVVRCSITPCRRCVINSGRVVPSCRAFRGNTDMAFIPIEEEVE